MSAVDISRQIVAEAIGVAVGEVSEVSNMYSLPGWDSIAHMKIILTTEERLGARLQPEFIVTLTAVRDLIPLFQ